MTTYVLKAALAGAGAAVLLAACSSSGGGTGTVTGPAGKAAGATVPASVPATSLGASIPAVPGGSSIGCNAVKLADAQALLIPKITKVELGPTGCAFERPGQAANGDNLSVDIRTNDTDHSTYKNLQGMGKNVALSGVGDEAYWLQPVPDASGPVVSAYKGTTSCVVEPPADLSVLTIAKGGNGPIEQVTNAAAAAFAAKMGVLCNDVFAAAG